MILRANNFLYSIIASALSEFATILTNPGRSLVYVCTLVIGMHLFFNFKIDKLFFCNRVVPVHGNAADGPGAGSNQSDRHLSSVINRTFQLIRQESAKLMSNTGRQADPLIPDPHAFDGVGS